MSFVYLYNSTVLFGLGLDSNIINNSLIENCIIEKPKGENCLSLYEFDSSKINDFTLKNN